MSMMTRRSFYVPKKEVSLFPYSLFLEGLFQHHEWYISLITGIAFFSPQGCAHMGRSFSVAHLYRCSSLFALKKFIVVRSCLLFAMFWTFFFCFSSIFFVSFMGFTGFFLFFSLVFFVPFLVFTLFSCLPFSSFFFVSFLGFHQFTLFLFVFSRLSLLFHSFALVFRLFALSFLVFWFLLLAFWFFFVSSSIFNGFFYVQVQHMPTF